ncbi:MAG TPA: cyclopropane fatty acyl phospholipid synthase [Candidatus Baltobacteraceae bacterium]|nr:cyclopropane fatty acyl phospholipid synthase [Candidatus Baltobacteraceae bacterium]
MSAVSPKHAIESILAARDIRIDGPRPWDLRILDERFYRRVLAGGSLAFGESYMDGWWTCGQVDELIARILRDDPSKELGVPWSVVAHALFARVFNAQDRSSAFRNGQAHYDIGNDLYEAMLDPRMVYTCAYWKEADDLAAAQEAKLDLVCRKIGLKPGDRILDIGCGWGSFLKFAAERYGASGVGITVAEEQVKLGKEKCAGLPIEIRLQDYRDVRGEFDHVVSLGMFEHVGRKNYRAYMQAAARCLKDGGLFLLHTIGTRTSGTEFDPWMDRYIFPNAHLPSMKEISAAAEGSFVIEDWHNFGPDYDKTLMAWRENFERRWDRLKGYDERFRRMWNYYLLACAGSFRSRMNQLWQVVLSKEGVPGGYVSVR